MSAFHDTKPNHVPPTTTHTRQHTKTSEPHNSPPHLSFPSLTIAPLPYIPFPIPHTFHYPYAPNEDPPLDPFFDPALALLT